MEDNRNPGRGLCLNLEKSPRYRRRNIWQDEVRDLEELLLEWGGSINYMTERNGRSS
jgi:hypothetical protein